MKRWLIVLALLMIVVSGSAQAQEDVPPLLTMLYQNSLVVAYQNGEFTPLQYCAPPGEAMAVTSLWVSPDGFRYAFLTAAAKPTSAANNVRICDLKAKRLIAVTGQPQTANIHSTPAWSLDGKQLAFVRLVSAENRLELVIYDLAKGSQKVVCQRDVGSDISLPPQVVWSPAGVVVFNTNAGGQTQPDVSEVVLYPQEFIASGEQGEAVVNQLDHFYDSLQLAIDEKTAAYSLVVGGYNQPYRLLDLATQQVSDLPGSFAWYNPLAPNAGFVQTLASNLGSEWVINGPDYSAVLNVPATTPESITVSPDGKQFAFVTFEDYPYGGKVYIITDPAAFAQSFGTPGNLQGVIHLTEFDGFYGQTGAIAVFWGPLALTLHS